MRSASLHNGFRDYRDNISMAGGNGILGNYLGCRGAIEKDIIVGTIGTRILDPARH